MLSPEFWRAVSAKKKFESLSGYSKNHCWNHGQVQTREGFARPVLRGFGVVQFTHLRDQCLGRSWANFSQAGWYRDIQGILCGAALLSQILSILEADLKEAHNSGSFGGPKTMLLSKPFLGVGLRNAQLLGVERNTNICCFFLNMDFFLARYMDAFHRSHSGWRFGMGEAEKSLFLHSWCSPRSSASQIVGRYGNPAS